MRTILLLLFISVIVSCDPEIGPQIDFSPSLEQVEVLEQVPTKEERRVFFMEFTGGACTNCPKGAEAVEEILTNHPNNFVPIAIHCAGLGGIFSPAPQAIQDFTLDEGTAYYNQFNGLAIPSASVDLFTFDGQESPILNPTAVTVNEWQDFYNLRAATSNPVNLSVEGTLEGGMLNVSAEVLYTEDSTTDHFITVYLLESHIIDSQWMPDASINTSYEHNHIVRQVLTPVSGSVLVGIGAEKVAGTKVTRNFMVEDIPDNWNEGNLELVAIVHLSGTSLEVLQAAKSKI